MIRIKKKKINPTDSEFIKNLRVEKFKLNNPYVEQYRYNVMYKDPVDGFLDYVGGAFYDAENKYILKVEINPYFQRKGAATYLYDHIEKDMGIKLKSSGTLRPDGEKFWENRLKKQNPTDKQFLSKIKIQKVPNIDPKIISYGAFLNNKYIAGVDFDTITKTIFDVWVSPNYRRKGLATFIYNKIEKDQKIKLKPSETLFPDGQEFWKARLKTG